MNNKPVTRQILAIIIGYHKPSKGDAPGMEVKLMAIKGVKPPKTPLPIW